MRASNGAVVISWAIRVARLAPAGDMKVIGTPSARHHDAPREADVTPLDHRAGNVTARSRAPAPDSGSYRGSGPGPASQG